MEHPTNVTSPEGDPPMRWWWVLGVVLIGSAAIGLFLYLVDPRVEQPAVAASILLLSVMLVGTIVGYRSEGETILETGVGGLVLLLLTAFITRGILGIDVPLIALLYSVFLVPLVCMLGGWTGEMLQGTLEEAHEDRAVDWPWVFVSIVVGITFSGYAVFLCQALLDFGPDESLAIFAASFLLTGWVVGHFSPGVTMVEPAIAAVLMIVVDVGLVILWFDGMSRLQLILIGFGGGMVMALIGGWLGERTQRTLRTRKST